MKIKKSVLSTLLLGTTIGAAQAQTEAGKLLLSGQVNYSQSKNEFNSTSTNPTLPLATLYHESKRASFSFSPQVGFFVADNLAIGVGVSLNSDRVKENRNESGNPYTYNYNSKNKGVTIGPFVRYYKMLGEKTGFYGQLAGGYQHQTQENTTNNSGNNGNNNYSYETKSNGSYGNLVPGFVFFPTPKIGLELTVGSLSYSKSKSELVRSSQPYQETSEGSSSGFGANFGLQYLAIGASFHLGN